MVFKITRKDDFFDVNPSAALINEFTEVQSRNMKYIALVFDYDSPLRNLSIEERKIKALNMLEFPTKKDGDWTKPGYDVMNLADARLIDAVHAYKKLMSDPDKSTLVAYKKQLEECQRFMSRRDKTATEMRVALGMRTEMDGLREAIKKLEADLTLRDQKDAIVDEKESSETSLSLVEQLNDEDA